MQNGCFRASGLAATSSRLSWSAAARPTPHQWRPRSDSLSRKRPRSRLRRRHQKRRRQRAQARYQAWANPGIAHARHDDAFRHRAGRRSLGLGPGGKGEIHLGPRRRHLCHRPDCRAEITAALMRADCVAGDGRSNKAFSGVVLPAVRRSSTACGALNDATLDESDGVYLPSDLFILSDVPEHTRCDFMQ